MVKRISVVCLVAVLIVSVTGVLTYAMDMRGKISFGGFGGYSVINPTEINQTLEDANDFFEWWFGGDIGTVTPLRGAMRFGGEVRYGVSSNLIIGAGYNTMSGSGKVTWEDPVLGWTGEYKEDLTVGGFTGSVLFATGGGNSSFYGGVGGGYYSGRITAVLDDSWDWWDESVVLEGQSTFGFHVIGGFEYFLSSNIAIGIEGMYNSITFPQEWTIIESDIYTVGDVWTLDPVQAGGITIGAGVRFYVG